jgi:hypothetical protein
VTDLPDSAPSVAAAPAPFRPAARQVSLLLLALVAGIMLWNTFAHPPHNIYDDRHHLALIEANENPLDWRPHPAAGLFDHLPVFYYAALGKIHRTLELASGREWHPYFTFRVFHAAFIVLIAALFAFSLLPRIAGGHPATAAWFLAAAFVVPNHYLSQVMVRSDHFLFLFINLLFYLWFRFDFPARLATSPWRLGAWGALLVGMANARNFCLAAYLVFLAWGLWVLVRHAPRARPAWWLGVAALLLATAAATSAHYVDRYLRTGRLFEQNQESERFLLYRQRAETFDRRLLFLNLEFDAVWREPSRHAVFHATTAWPARWLGIPARDPSFEDDQNSFLPRLYSDMWGDHWLYFSGQRIRRIEGASGWALKYPLKRAALLAAAPFTLAFFLIPAGLAVAGGLGLLRGRAPTPGQTASAIFMGAFALLVLWIHGQPEPGANVTVKFCYLFGYAWLPLLGLAEYLAPRPRLRRAFQAYTWALLLLALPLGVFIR